MVEQAKRMSKKEERRGRRKRLEVGLWNTALHYLASWFPVGITQAHCEKHSVFSSLHQHKNPTEQLHLIDYFETCNLLLALLSPPYSLLPLLLFSLSLPSLYFPLIYSLISHHSLTVLSSSLSLSTFTLNPSLLPCGKISIAFSSCPLSLSPSQNPLEEKVRGAGHLAFGI